MKSIARPWLSFIFALSVVPFVLLGCGSAGSSIGGNGVGADGGPWPSAPTRNTTTTNTTTAAAPKVPLTVLLHATAGKEQTLALNVKKVELKYDKDHWLTLATTESIGKLQSLPFRADEHGATALLTNGPVERRTFTAVRLTFSKDNTAIEEGKSATGLTIDTVTLNISDWTPDVKGTNTLTLTVDGTRVERTKASARLDQGAITAKTSMPAGGITGTIAPVIPATQIEVIYGETKVPFATTVPAIDGYFTFANLPSGKYHLKITLQGYKLSEPLTKPVAVQDKMVTLDKLQLVKEAEAAGKE